MNTVRSEDGLHPYFAVFVQRLKKIKRLAYKTDEMVHITPRKMAIIKGTDNKLKITIFQSNPKIIFIKLYGPKVVQSFFLEYTNLTLAREFEKQIQHVFKEEIVK